jgi:hypothetical protein
MELLTTTDPAPSNGEAFRAVMAPTVQAIIDLTAALDAVTPRHGHLPAASSTAMAEIAAEASYWARTDWDGPFRDTHTFGGITLFAASDYARSFAELFRDGPTPVYGHLPLARGALEACTVAYWLNEPIISLEERVKRGLCEQLYSAQELVRLDIEPGALARVARWQSVAAAFGWPFTKATKPAVGEAIRPSVPRGINDLLLKPGEWDLGRVQWCYLSAVGHVTWWGLRQSVIEPPGEPGAAGRSLAGFGTESSAVQAQAVCILGALRNAATARFTLMGWADDEWAAACRASQAHEAILIRGFPVAGPGGTTTSGS